jgi:hypothetical protein
MPRRDRYLLGHAIASAIVSAFTWGHWVTSDSGGALALALGVHVSVAALTTWLVEPSRRALALALGIAVPVLGPAAAAIASSIIGRGGDELLFDPHAVQARIDGAEIARRLTHSMPVCEALASADADARRQALAKLKARGAAEDIAILRWARTQRRGDAAVEVALAFEEISTRFEQQLASARAAAIATPTYTSLSAVFVIAAGGITNGVVDGPLVARVAAECARHHSAAVALDPDRGRELLVTRVRVELALHRPDEALVLLDGSARHGELGELYLEAAYAARRFDLVPELARGDA